MRYALVENFLTVDECREIIEISKSRLQPSTVWNVSQGISEKSDYRTSEFVYFFVNENPLVGKIEQRIAEFTYVPVENGEGFQIVHYSIGQYYKTHCDHF